MELVPPRQLDVGVVGCGFAVRHDAAHDWRVDSLQWWIRVAAWSGIPPRCVPHLDIERPSAPVSVVDRKYRRRAGRRGVCACAAQLTWCVRDASPRCLSYPASGEFGRVVSDAKMKHTCIRVPSYGLQHR